MIIPEDLHRPASLGIEHTRLRYDGAGELTEAIGAALVDAGLLDRPVDLTSLHRHLPPSACLLDEHYMNEPTRALYGYVADLEPQYHDLVRHVVAQLGGDALFQCTPIVRVHLPGPFPANLMGASGRGIQVHSDTLGGHPFEMLNVWLALTSAEGDAALHLAPRAESVALLEHFCETTPHADYESSLTLFHARLGGDADFETRVRTACTAMAGLPGDLFVFDPRCLHGGMETAGPATRVSLDFRVVPLPTDAPEAAEDRLAAGAPRWRRGELLDSRSAHELRP